MQVQTGCPHIILDKRRVPHIEGTSMKVIELVQERQAYGWSPEELHFQHPYLTLGQIHSALAYYSDHAAELDEDIARRAGKAERLRRSAAPAQQQLVARLKSKKNR